MDTKSNFTLLFFNLRDLKLDRRVATLSNYPISTRILKLSQSRKLINLAQNRGRDTKADCNKRVQKSISKTCTSFANFFPETSKNISLNRSRCWVFRCLTLKKQFPLSDQWHHNILEPDTHLAPSRQLKFKQTHLECQFKWQIDSAENTCGNFKSGETSSRRWKNLNWDKLKRWTARKKGKRVTIPGDEENFLLRSTR